MCAFEIFDLSWIARKNKENTWFQTKSGVFMTSYTEKDTHGSDFKKSHIFDFVSVFYDANNGRDQARRLKNDTSDR